MGLGSVVSTPVTSTAETLFETPTGSGLGETPLKALLTTPVFRQWFIFCSSFLQYDDEDFIPGFFAFNPSGIVIPPVPLANPVPTNVSRYTCPFWTFAEGELPIFNPGAPLQDPYTCYFEITLGQPDLSDLSALSLSPFFGYWGLIAELPPPHYAPSAGWRYMTLDALFDTSWLLQDDLGLGYLCTGAVTDPPYRPDIKPLFEPHGFAVFPSPNFKVDGYAPYYSEGFFNLVPPFPGEISDCPFGTTICLNKAGTKGCIALHDYDDAHNLMPCDPSTIQVVDLAVDGPVFYNGPSSTAATGQALVFWIGLTQEEVPQTPDMTPFTPASKGLLTVQ